MTRTFLAGAAALALVACGKGSNSQTAAADSLRRDLQLAPAESTVALNDRPTETVRPAPAANPRPAAPKPVASAPAPAPTPRITTVTLAGGTAFSAAANDSLHSRHDKAGQTITATVHEDIKDARGWVGIPAGSVVTLKVLELEPAKSKSAKDGIIRLEASSVSINGRSYSLNAEVTAVEHSLQGQGVTAGGAARVAGGAAVGAIAGKIIGGKTGAIVGGVAGAAAGTAVAANTADRDVVVAPGAMIDIQLVGDLTIQK